MKYHSNGFSLVELSIVLVIIGLLAAGTIGGKALMEQSRLRSIITDFNRYKSATDSFVLQYRALPGDLSNAKSYWTSCTDAAPNLCNGDGDDLIEEATYEDVRVWQHLTLAGYLQGSYTGLVSGTRFAIGVNAPKSSIDSGTFQIYSRAPGAATLYGDTAIGVYARYGALDTTNKKPIEKLLLSIDAYTLDKKFDDGAAGTGWFQTYRGNSVEATNVCVSQKFDSSTLPTYHLTETVGNCRIHLKLS
ncbi:MAG: prepilin-type N-terminal cleavage/methylation protein [Rickettsiales bacterium]|nr:prepilin-type N-terminal cleavage/methylation protein [Rickettsiales bacterium]